MGGERPDVQAQDVVEAVAADGGQSVGIGEGTMTLWSGRSARAIWRVFAARGRVVDAVGFSTACTQVDRAHQTFKFDFNHISIHRV